MTPDAKIVSLYRYPVKGLSPEPLQQVALDVGQTFPADRRYAIENGPSGFDPTAPVWRSKTHYLMLARNERLAGYRTLFDDRSNVLTIRKHGEVVAAADLESAAGREVIEHFFATHVADDLKGPPKLLSGGGHSFSDDVSKLVSIINLASVAAVEAMVGAAVNPLRFRANLYLEGWPAWHEFDLVGASLAIGDIRLKLVKPITRCAAVNVDPDTAARDLELPATLMRRLGRNECGIFAEVTAGGTIGIGDEIVVDEP